MQYRILTAPTLAALEQKVTELMQVEHWQPIGGPALGPVDGSSAPVWLQAAISVVSAFE
jgi:hypothetical protein